MKNLLLSLFVMVVVAATGRISEASTVWSVNGASCIPTGDFAVNISAGALTAGSSSTVICYAPVTKAQTDAGAINKIEITYKGSTTTGVNIKAELVSLSKSTGSETVMGSVTSSGSSSITSQYNSLLSNSFNWNSNFYYVRVTLTSGNVSGQLQTLYGVSLLWL